MVPGDLGVAVEQDEQHKMRGEQEGVHQLGEVDHRQQRNVRERDDRGSESDKNHEGTVEEPVGGGGIVQISSLAERFGQ